MIYIPFFIVILIDKRDDKKEQLTEATGTSMVLVQVQGTSTETRYQVQKQGTDTRDKVQSTGTKIQVQATLPRYQRQVQKQGTKYRY